MMDQETGWWSLIGPIPSQIPAGIIAVPHDRTAELDHEYQIGPVTVRPGEKLLTEYLRSEPFQLDGITDFESRPVIAEAKWPGNLIATSPEFKDLGDFSGQEANERGAARWTYRVACLLSLAWHEAWQVRTAATDRNRLPPAVPADWPEPYSVFGGDSYELPASSRSIPEWIPGAWDRLANDRELMAALAAWHQGRLLTPQFPSYANVAFCGSIETIAKSKALRGSIEVSVEPCRECGNVPSAGATFWATVGLVRDQNTVQTMKRTNPYGSRSRTVHQSTTHGIESMYGSMHMLKFVHPDIDQPGSFALNDGDRSQAFMWRELPVTERVAEDLLLMAFHAGM
jgi:hypothetical protein